MGKIMSFRTADKKKISDEAHTEDFLAAEQFKKVYLGKLALYYKDFPSTYCLPYEYISRAYKGVSIVTPDDSPAIEYFRLILIHEGAECANIIFGERDSELVDRLVHRIKQIHPQTEIGYVPPPEQEKKKGGFFSFFTK